MVTHSDAGLSVRHAKLKPIGFAFKQREIVVAVITTVLYRNHHPPIQGLPRRVTICILESIKATQSVRQYIS